ncbi:MAG: hypothetical protein ACFE9Z_14400 [Promethearchaeota archaeon]
MLNSNKNIKMVLVLLLLLYMTLFSPMILNLNISLTQTTVQNPRVSQSIEIVSPENKTYTEPMNGYYPGTFGFENDEIGETNPMKFNTSYSAADCKGVVITERDGHQRVLNVSDDNLSGSAVIMQKFEDAGFENQTFGTIEFWFRIEAGTSMKNTEIRLNWGLDPGEAATNIRIYGALQQWQFYKDAWTPIPNVADPLNNTWHHIGMHFRCFGATPYVGLGENQYEVIIDGISSGLLDFQQSADQIAMFIPTHTQTAGYKDNYAYLDAIGYSWDPNYNIGDNLKEGLHLSFDDSTTLDWIGYSLDNNANNTIWGNTTISLPNNGPHSIQVFGNDSIGAIHSSVKRYFTINFIPFDIFTPENKTYISSMDGYYPGTFGFENDEIGETNPMKFNTSYSAADCKGVVITERDGHQRVLNVSDDNLSGSAVIMQKFEDAGFENQTFGTIEFWFRIEAGTSMKNTEIRLNWGLDPGEAATNIRIYGALQQWQFYNGSWTPIPNVADPLNNTWHHIRIHFRCFGATPYVGLGENQFEVIIDGTSSGLLDFQQSADQIAMFIPTHTQAAGYKDNYAYLDAIGYSWDPNYNIGDNLKEGLLLSFEAYVNLEKFWYSLDNHESGIIFGNSTIPMLDIGIHKISVFGMNTHGAIFHSYSRYFSVKEPITLITPENTTYTAPMEGYYPATFGFENDADGNDPEMWTVNEAGGTVQVIPSNNGHNKIVELHEMSDDFTGITNIFTARTNGTVEYWVKVNRLDDWFGIGIYNGTTFEGIHLSFADDGNIKYNDGSNWITITNYSANTWYHFKVEWNCTTDWHLWIDGISQDGGLGYPYRNSPPNLDRVYFFTSNAGLHQNQYMYIDAVGYSWDPYYNLGNNIDEGLLLNFNIEFNKEWLGYSLNGVVYGTIFGNTTIEFPIDGLHTIQIYGNDTFGSYYESNIQYFLVDTTNPIMNILSPSTDDFFGNTPPSFQISYTELNVDSTWYYLGPGTLEVIFSGVSGSINQSEWDKLGEGFVTIRFYINDTGGHESFDEIIVQKELTPPTSSIMFFPHTAPNIVNVSTSFSIFGDDGTGSGVSLLRYRINNSIWYDYTGSFDLSGYSYGYYLIGYQAIDEVGNIESENTLLVKLVEAPSGGAPAIPGSNISIILSLSGLISLILILRYKKIITKF